MSNFIVNVPNTVQLSANFRKFLLNKEDGNNHVVKAMRKECFERTTLLFKKKRRRERG